MDEQNIENEQIQDNQTQDTVQQGSASDTNSTELVDYQTHVIKSLERQMCIRDRHCGGD